MPPPHLSLARWLPDTGQNAAGPPAPGPEPWRLPMRRVYPTALSARLWPRPGCPGRLAAGLWLPAAVGTRYLSPNQAHGPPRAPAAGELYARDEGHTFIGRRLPGGLNSSYGVVICQREYRHAFFFGPRHQRLWA